MILRNIYINFIFFQEYEFSWKDVNTIVRQNLTDSERTSVASD